MVIIRFSGENSKVNYQESGLNSEFNKPSVCQTQVFWNETN